MNLSKGWGSRIESVHPYGYIIVIGTETGKRKGKIDTKPEWAFNLAKQAQKRSIPIFMKEDLYGILSEEEMIQEFPKEFARIEG